MGMGDVKMMVGVGLMLGGAKTFLTLFLAALIGSALGVFFARSKGQSLQLKIPFGIFLGSFSIVALLWGDRIISWYLGFFRL
jgi:prepilin signal peptidase PulO-like enzyme (type II secretory pathway)